MKTLRAMCAVGALMTLGAVASGCSTGEIPQGHRGRMFDKTGAMAFWAGGRGLVGPVLGPGSYFTGIYDDLRLVQCTQVTTKETLHSLTKDGVQFALDVYTRYSADCSNEGVKLLLVKVSPNEEGVVTVESLYAQFIRPMLGEATREVVSPYVANDVNNFREKIVGDIRTRFMDMLAATRPQLVTAHELNLSNLDFPDEMDVANTERAVQAVKRDTAIAERGRVNEETTTATLRINLARQQALAQTAVIDEVGNALRRNPEYLQYQMQQLMPQIYQHAGAQGNMVIAAPSPNILVSPRSAPAAR